MNDALSEETRRFRRQTVSVNIKITFLSWAMEFCTGIGVILAFLFAGEKSIHIYRISIVIIGFIVTPFTYILNREVTKQVIVLENWMKGIKTTIMNGQEAAELLEGIERQVR